MNTNDEIIPEEANIGIIGSVSQSNMLSNDSIGNREITVRSDGDRVVLAVGIDYCDDESAFSTVELVPDDALDLAEQLTEIAHEHE
ncbi:hypothetical protein [Halocatena halophila]|uniref:hypothetical protein n=1 Tax=Halocatena halophila TaxID=2814576 RepID=UPI002ED2EA86